MEINEKSCFALWDQLLGALVALARAAENEPPSPSAHRAVLDGLACVLACYDARRLEEPLSAVRAEKDRLAPLCATCTSPCGRTAAYGLRDLLAEPDARLRALKLSLLFSLQGLARCALAAQTDGLPDEETLSFFYRGLFALGYLFGPERLRELAEEGGLLALRRLEAGGPA